MASIVNIRDNVYEAVLRAAREKSNDEAEFLEVFDEVILNRKKEVFDRVVSKMRKKNIESLKNVHDKFVEAYLNAKEKYKLEPKKLIDWVATNLQTC